jgi:hypothetical protein
MTKDDIIRMAREAGCVNCDCCLPDPEPHEMQEFIERFAALVAAHTTPPQRPWVGLTMLNMAELRQGGFHNITDEHFQAIENKIREKNGG